VIFGTPAGSRTRIAPLREGSLVQLGNGRPVYPLRRESTSLGAHVGRSMSALVAGGQARTASAVTESAWGFAWSIAGGVFGLAVCVVVEALR
jgi:hypothetical protein